MRPSYPSGSGTGSVITEGGGGGHTGAGFQIVRSEFGQRVCLADGAAAQQQARPGVRIDPESKTHILALAAGFQIPSLPVMPEKQVTSPPTTLGPRTTKDSIFHRIVQGRRDLISFQYDSKTWTLQMLTPLESRRELCSIGKNLCAGYLLTLLGLGDMKT